MSADPSDLAIRQRFAQDLDRNFSVVAAAGSGKTTSITERIIALAQSPGAAEKLPRLVVVTFTNRAANEMQQRARTGILKAGVDVATAAAFNRAFFGTLHSFCVKLLRDHGYVLGLPGRFEVLTDDTELWDEFFQSQAAIGSTLSPAQRGTLLRHVQARHLMELGRRAQIEPPENPGDPPPLDLEPLLAFVPSGNSKRTIPRLQAELAAWRTACDQGEDFLPLPACTTEAKGFVALWETAFQPFRRWLNQCALFVAAETARAYRELRISRGALTYADQVEMAFELFSQPDAARRIREKEYIVILDEAQDTDPLQFALLLEMTRPVHAAGRWLETQADPPAPGRFCMVGDFQQAIYGDRADLPFYRRVSETLGAGECGEELKFDVTFRLDRAQLEFVNAVFQPILDGASNQARFIGLNPRPTVLPGQIVRLDIEPPEGELKKDGERGAFEAARIAAWLKNCALDDLRASKYSDIAILCPRKAWLKQLEIALRKAGLEVEVHSEREVNGDSPAYAWLTALAVIMAEPTGGYEIVGVLREIFGVSDHDLAAFSQGDGTRFRIDRPVPGNGAVESALTLLRQCRDRALPLPLLDTLREILQSVELRARLDSLPHTEYPGQQGELDLLLAQAARAEAAGSTLAEFADHLRRNFTREKETRPAARDAINLITCQKAKGSEWQTVIVPFLARKIHGASPEYPRLAKSATGDVVALLDGADVDSEDKTASQRSTRQELARILYVALTRTRHTLVLVDDTSLFHDKRGLPKESLAALLQIDGKNREPFDKLEYIPTPCAKTRQDQESRVAESSAEAAVEPPPSLPRDVATRARRTAAAYVEKINPSGLAEARYQESGDNLKETEFRPAALDNDATRYGSWWHTFAERIPWPASASRMQSLFESHLGESADPARSEREWALLKRHFEKKTPLGRRLTAPGLIIHPEMPFLWKMDETRCLEGIIDLAVYDPAGNRWLILDWKTNRLTPAEAEALRPKFLPQIAAYWQAMRAMFDAEVTAGVYSTATGLWLEFSEDELRRFDSNAAAAAAARQLSTSNS